MKSYYIVGNKGNMASRYTSILKYLGFNVCGHDFAEAWNYKDLADSDGIIIATPTDCHFSDLVESLATDLPILCEKPLLNWNIRGFESNVKPNKSQISVVNQYAYLVDDKDQGSTYYNYFKSGKDGLVWDCYNIIGLSHQKPELRNDSPIWTCIINGRELSLSRMDEAYVEMMNDWTKNDGSYKYGFDYALNTHAKLVDWFVE